MAIRSFDIETIMWSIESVLPDFRFEVTGATLADGNATVEWVLHGTNTEPLKPGIEPTGKTVQLRGVEIVEGANGFTRESRPATPRHRLS